MKKVIVMLILMILVISSATFVMAGNNKAHQNNGRPFTEIWNAIDSALTYNLSDMWDAINALENLVLTFVTIDTHNNDIQGLQNQIDALEVRLDACGCPGNECVVGDTEACYTGPANTLNVGICHEGLKTCLEGNVWGNCEDEVTPIEEICGDDIDQDCNGFDELCVIDCDDDNICTDDIFDVNDGCVYVNNADICDDDNICTINDQCSEGMCIGGGFLECIDGNECTEDSCNPLSGCIYPNVADGTLCNGGECYSGVCVSAD